jgi:hypothetical protein
LKPGLSSLINTTLIKSLPEAYPEHQLRRVQEPLLAHSYRIYRSSSSARSMQVIAL